MTRTKAREILWRRIDQPGHEVATLIQESAGWQLRGVAVFASERGPCSLEYQITCDQSWHTRAAAVTGWIGAESVVVRVEADGTGSWRLNGKDVPAVTACIDIDLAFSPSTNLLPIRRLQLAMGATALVRAAWLTFPMLTLQPLEQRYQRLDDQRYRYESGGGAFTAVLRTNDAGFVVDYPGLWRMEEPR